MRDTYEFGASRTVDIVVIDANVFLRLDTECRRIALTLDEI